MSYFLTWLPVALAVIPLIAITKIIGAIRRLSGETSRLSQTLFSFFAADHDSSKIAPKYEPKNLENALKNRRQFVSQRNERKRAKQRRLVKRLRGISSKESE